MRIHDELQSKIISILSRHISPSLGLDYSDLPSDLANMINEIIEEACESQRIRCEYEVAGYLISSGLPITKGVLTNPEREGYSADINGLFLHILNSPKSF